MHAPPLRKTRLPSKSHHRPLVLLVLAALLPLVVLSAVLGGAWLRGQQSAMEANAVALVDRLSALVDRELSAQTDALKAVAASPLLDSLAAGRELDAVTFFEYAERVQGALPLWTTIVLSDVEGNRLVDAPFLVGGVRGRVLDMDSHRRVVETGQPAVGTILRGPRGGYAFPIRVPVTRNGAPVAVLSAVVMPEGFQSLLFGNRLPPGWIAAVIDAEGRVVARAGGEPDMIGRHASENALRARRAAGSGVYDGMSLEGAPTVVAFRTLPNYGWSVHFAIPQDAYRAPVSNAVWLAGAGALASLLMAGAFLWLLARELRLRRRQEAAREESLRLEALGRMTGGVAHDIANLLTVVMSGIAAIRSRPNDPERITRVLPEIEGAVARGQALMRQMAAFGRRSVYEPVPFRLQDRKAALEALLARSAGSGVDTALIVPDDLWPIIADPDAMEVALLNLAVNARDAMPDGGALTIMAENRALPERRGDDTGLSGDFVALAVRDTGTGIPPEHLRRIFEPFFTTKPDGKGTGLGLSQVFGFARQSGGTVTVTSTAGAGTTVTLYLPRAATDEGSA
ncbi:C4-dicarboxylate-specific signal transduction histidine kinase [Azospirillum baldaniorum]|uniref:histidine kinase n=1 Tax=Azospirillum baldaniorum TaxID=1064539 RepID=A0A9P1NK89_9PROT|nr:C4-dicarboxylate-specific signal transduction histidine kinase [Azospirillum baldaniorum]CCC96290.1 sensor protein [Azospirillum baldaniorum]